MIDVDSAEERGEGAPKAKRQWSLNGQKSLSVLVSMNVDISPSLDIFLN